MIRLRKSRTPLRTKITRLRSQVKTLLNEDDVDTKALKMKLMSLDSTWREMEEVNTKIKTQLLDDDAPEEDIQAEYDDMEYYEETYHTLRQDIVNELQKHVSPAPSSTAASESVSGEKKRQYKLPKIELMKFDGELKSWLAWWSQYKKIHEDDELDDSDKFQYLCQSIKADTEAKEIVMSYPLSADNYDKAVKALQERFGRDDLQLQYYVRELLSLVISNVTKKDKLPLSSLYLKLDSQLRSLATLKLDEADPATWLFPLVESSLSEETLRAWQRSPLSKEISDSTSEKKTRLEYLMEFIKAEVMTEQQIAMAQSAFQSTTIDTEKNKKGKARSTTRIFGGEDIATAAGVLSTQASPACAFCEGKHESDRCVKAQSLTLAERTEKVKQQRLCFRCLRPDHHSAKCKTIVKCITCQGRHFPIMCRGRKDEKEEIRAPPRKTETETQQDPALVGAQSGNFSPSFYSTLKPFTPGNSTSSAANQCSGEVMLNTFKVRLVGPHSSMIVRVVADTGSQRSYIRREVVRKMGCQRIGEEQIQNVLFGNYITPPTIHHKYSATLHNVNGTNGGTYDFLERDEICGNLPQVPKGPWINELQLAGIQLSDVGSSCDVIDILIGSDKWGSILTGNIIKLNSGLVAIETILGWTVSGKLPRLASNLAATVTSLLCTSNDISQLWSLETLGIRDSIESKTIEEQELEATRQFQKNLSYDGETYTVALPWKSNDFFPPTNRTIAERRLQRAAQQLCKNGQFRMYDDVFRNWEQEGFITEVINDDNTGHYLPHRPVFKESTTTPVRPVFDASCKVGNHPSLNNCLHKGPNLLELIPSLLLRFREQVVGVSSDIRKAFQMIKVREEDQQFQKFLWYTDELCQQTKVYKHQRVVFGMTCSPFILAATINHHLQTCKDKELATKLASSYYVDNCLTSVSSLNEYEDFKMKATYEMSKAGMELRQWAYSLNVGPKNTKRNSENCNEGICFGKEKMETTVSVLGLKWNRNHDTLACVIPDIDCNMTVTKRPILSLVAHVFDPIGFLAPALIPLKLIIQDTWVQALGWDVQLPDEMRNKFEDWTKQASVLVDIEIPRYCQLWEGDSREIHIFVDASSYAYAGAVYMRTQKQDKVKIQLLLAKSRLAPSTITKKGEPSKRATIPRLELMACVIGTRLGEQVKKVFNCENLPFTYWSDSTTALAWIHRHDHWGTFVGNRVAEIVRCTSPSQWHHVPGHLNPADLPSRGCSPKELVRSTWWEGPSWLYREQSSWPHTEEEVNEDSVNVEKKKCAAFAVTTTVELPPFSSYRKNVAIFAWVLRFIKIKLNWPKLDSLPNPKKNYVTVGELRAAEKVVLRQVQKQMFPDVTNRTGGMMIVVDNDGLLRVQTRLTNRKDSADFVCPILLPKNHPLTESLITDFHKYFGHAGVQFIMSKLREKYWILQSRRTIKRVLRKCAICRRHQSKPFNVVPAALPIRRVSHSEPFDTTGVDLGGPLFLKDGTKCWFVVFTCAYYRCVHLDLVLSLNTEAFLGALERFVSLYGRPNTVYSDNGTNFHGAVNVFRELDWIKIEAECGVRQINWIFNPPTAAWWGGWWERMVRSVKDLLKRMLGKSRLTYDELRTCMAGVCRTINDRPLTVVSEDGDDLIPLTPSMFMRMRVNGGMPETVDANSLRRGYFKMKSLQQQLEQRFRKEYLSLLVQHGKERGKPEKVTTRNVTSGH